MPGPGGINAVCWHISPACARILERLECRGDDTHDGVAKPCHVSEKYACALMRVLKRAEVIHIVAWRHNTHGAPTPIYRLGPGKNKPMPKPETTAQRMKKRRDSMREMWGTRATNIALSQARHKGTVVIDGKQIRPGDHKAQLAGRIT